MASTTTDEIIWELQDQVQRLDRKMNALCEAAGINPEQAGRLPDDPAPESARAA